MARWAPNILSATSGEEGGIKVTWEKETFFADSEDPEKVLIGVNGALIEELGGDETSFEIPANLIAPPMLTIGVIFRWEGPPSEEKQDVIQIPVQGAVTGGGASVKKPEVTVVDVLPRTRNRANQIKIHWESRNFNNGHIRWGWDPNNLTGFQDITPAFVRERGDFTAQPLQSGLLHYFRVEVRNTTQQPSPWHSTTIAIHAAIDTLSVAQFLRESGLARTTPLATVVGPDKSVRKWVLG